MRQLFLVLMLLGTNLYARQQFVDDEVPGQELKEEPQCECIEVRNCESDPFLQLLPNPDESDLLSNDGEIETEFS